MSNFELFIPLILGLFGVIRFRQLGLWVHRQSSGMITLPEKWDILFMQGMFFFVGSLFFTVSISKLIYSLDIPTSNNLLDWYLAFLGIYFIISFRQVTKVFITFQQKYGKFLLWSSRLENKDIKERVLFKNQVIILVIGIMLLLLGLARIFLIQPI